MANRTHITVYEHESLRVGHPSSFKESHRQALENYYGEGCAYFNLIHNGVKFNEYVGVIQVGALTIEVLPKADRDTSGKDETAMWQGFLISMLRAAGLLPQVTGSASLLLRANTILDLYMQLFLKEAHYIIQTGLVRQYRKEEGNMTALKGRLQFAENIRHNLTHAERFYVRHTVYDRDHIYNAILLQTLKLISHISTSEHLVSDARALMLDFPDCQEAKITEELFDRLVYTRKTDAYRTAHHIARMLLLNYHPDVRKGSSNVLALMFDMNMLWEKYIMHILRKGLNADKPGKYILREQVRTNFWLPESGSMRNIRPDIVVYEATKPEKALIVIDTKWKRVQDNHPSIEDLKQMLVYNLYQGCDHSALVYPASQIRPGISGAYKFIHGTHCSLQFVHLEKHTNCIKPDIKGLVKLIENTQTDSNIFQN